MNNPFNKGDKVSIKIKGQAVEAWVTQTWNQEVQVRTRDNKLIWRVAKTVTLVEAAKPTTETVSQPPAANSAGTVSKPAAKQSKGTSTIKKHPAKSVPYKRTRSQSNRRKKI